MTTIKSLSVQEGGEKNPNGNEQEELSTVSSKSRVLQ